MPDQSAIRKYVKDILILEDRFNEQRSIKPKTVVKHFNKGIKWFPFFHIYNYKQWQIDNVHKKLKIFMFDDIYDQYKNLLKNSILISMVCLKNNLPAKCKFFHFL